MEGEGGELERGERELTLIQRRLYNGDNKYDRAMARIGQYKCPHFGIYCPGPGQTRTINCNGAEDCPRIGLFAWLGGQTRTDPLS